MRTRETDSFKMDLGDLTKYNPKTKTIAVLRDDFRLLLAHYCRKKKGLKTPYSFEDILNVIRLIVIELKSKKRKTTDFNPKSMKPCAREAYEKATSKDYPNVKQSDTVKVHPSGIEKGRDIKLNEVLEPLSEAVLLSKSFVILTGGIVNQGNTKGDLDFLIRKKEPSNELEDIPLKFRISRAFPVSSGIRNRIHFLYDIYSGPFTNSIDLFDLYLIPSYIPVEELDRFVRSFKMKHKINLMSVPDLGDNKLLELLENDLIERED